MSADVSTAPILITGAGQRVGHYCANRLLDEGYRVWISYRRETKRVAQLRERGALCIEADFACESSIRAFIASVREQTDTLRAIVHNASAWLPDRPGSEADVMQQMVAVHMLAPYMINLGLADLFRQAGQSDIVHITDYVVEAASDHHIAYAATKAGLDSMTRSFAKRLAPTVQVNAIQPALLIFNPDDDDEFRARALAKSLLGIEPGEQALYSTLKYLLDNNYVTGRTMKLDGGRHLKSDG